METKRVLARTQADRPLTSQSTGERIRYKVTVSLALLTLGDLCAVYASAACVIGAS
jgi:hypothetical protein